MFLPGAALIVFSRVARPRAPTRVRVHRARTVHPVRSRTGYREKRTTTLVVVVFFVMYVYVCVCVCVYRASVRVFRVYTRSGDP